MIERVVNRILINDEAVINLLTQCGETSLLNVSFKNMYTSGCYY